MKDRVYTNWENGDLGLIYTAQVHVQRTVEEDDAKRFLSEGSAALDSLQLLEKLS